MLQDIRNNAQGTIAKVIIGLLIISLSIWGMDAIIGGFSGEPEVATVNGEDITEREFLRVVQIESQRRLGQMERPDPTLLDEDQIRQQVLQSLIREEILSQDAASQGLLLSEADIDALITRMPRFQVDGTFSRDRFVSVVRSMGMGVAEFRELLRSQYVVNQIRNGIIQSAMVSPQNVQRLLSLQNQSRDFRTVTLTGETVEDQVSVSDEEVAGYYANNQQQFRRPEQVKARYLVLSLDSLADEVTVTEEEVRSLYEQRAQALAKEERRAAHILIEDGGEASKTIDTIQQRLEEGEDFADLAAEYSIDSFSAEDGGDLGFAGRGVYEEAFEEALYSLKPGEVSEPVSTRFGIHLIKLLDIRKSEAPEFAAMQDELRRELARKKAESRFAEARAQLADSAYSADSLEAPAEEFGLEVREAGGITPQGGPPPFDHEGLVRQLFSADVLKDGYNTEVIDVEDNMAVVARVAEHQPERVLPLEEVSDGIRGTLEAQKIRDALADKAEAIIAELKSGSSLSDIKGINSGWSVFRNQSRNTQDQDPVVLQQVFSMPRPNEEAPVYDSVYTGEGMVIISLSAVNEGDGEASDAEKQQLSRLLTSLAGQQEYLAYQRFLRNNAEVERP